MKTIVLQDDKDTWQNLLPLTYTRPISYLRIGIDTIKQKWEEFLGKQVAIETEPYLMPKFQSEQVQLDDVLYINSSIIPTQNLVNEILQISKQSTLECDGKFIASRRINKDLPTESKEYNGSFISIDFPWDIFTKNHIVFLEDFKRITDGRTSQPISDTNQLLGEYPIFLEMDARVECSILNTTNGPIYVGKGATIMEGCMVQGGLALGDYSTLKMGCKHYGTSTIGPHSKIGGEISNIVVQGYSNKGHDGYLGNAVIGEWCNIGADTNSSNLKNNYSLVKAFNYKENKLIDTNQQFVGLMMGDHSKCGINTMFNTATVVGVAANIFGGDFPKKHIPSFAWGGINFVRTFVLNKAFDMAESMMQRRGIEFTAVDREIFKHIFEETKQYRNS